LRVSQEQFGLGHVMGVGPGHSRGEVRVDLDARRESVKGKSLEESYLKEVVRTENMLRRGSGQGAER